ncbi:pimeloyl-ACP methyl ester carboxylesterase [Sphingomicrobium lutaoense]|uniref:Pimeloyl-ACP methyl ester carboxylesterase n=2 Tax=Sphingomicrobium lutaoense TaxID=515949 RepID=A0A839YYC1_9SPHN|nr:hypothetical protein [Sphingomicrobium lutaoense]MBB3763480.1 pimeloyl-ACP methyl ester carboxylesterase [Sphingomicrobium lutaoense]
MAVLLASMWPQALTTGATPLAFEDRAPRGDDRFELHFGQDKTRRSADVFVYRASTHSVFGPVLFILPGEKRNALDYRDAWVDAAERYGLMIIVPRFDSRDYRGSAGYNLANMLREERRHRYDTPDVNDPEDWLFSDIERIFDHSVARYGLAQRRYDLFGHSAGGQIVHRMVMFAPEARINRAVAANAGWYTAPELNAPFPYGLAQTPQGIEPVENAFDRQLVIMLGELDDRSERRGTLRQTRHARRQGRGRVERGQFFYEKARELADSADMELNWSLEVVDGVGHNYREMSRAAAHQLYGAPTVKYSSL